MAVSILSAGRPDQRLVLSNGQWAAKLAIGSSWNSIRIGVRWAVTDSGVSTGSGSKIYVGMMSNPATGLTNGPLTTSTSHFVGLMNSGVNTRSASPNRYSISNFRFTKRINSTETLHGGGLGNMFVNCTPASYRNAFVVDIIKGSPNFSLGVCSCGSGTGAVNIDISETLLKDSMVLPAFSDVDESLETAGGGTTGYNATSGASVMAVDEATDGVLNSIVLAWNQTSIDFEFSEVFFAIMS